ncbi:MAG: polysaccharide deacetylase family protein [Gemmatimonadales bacterium]
MITLEYHDVVDAANFDASGFPGAAANSYKLTLPLFDQHLQALAGRPGCGGDVRSAVAAGDSPVLLTFDDGGISAHTVIASALERSHFLGHFFVTTSRIGSPGFCTTDALRALAGRGHVVGSHSHTHPVRMAKLTDRELREEWQISIGLLAEILGAPPVVASVPGGYYSRRIARAAAAEGIRYLFTSEPVTGVHMIDGCQVLGRFTLRRGSPAREVRSLVGHLGAARVRQWAVWNAKKVVKRLGGETYLRIRNLAFSRGNGPTEPEPGS